MEIDVMNKAGLLPALLFLLMACGTDSSSAGAPSTRSSTTDDEVARPVGLDIAALGVHVTDLETTGSDTRGDYNCPRDPAAVAWNSDGTFPGEPGLAVMIAAERGVFQGLKDLTSDAMIVVARADGTQATFRETDPSKTPASARPSRLELIGCGDQSPVTVYAELVPEGGATASPAPAAPQ
jgi:hypothetical protein